MKKRRKKHVLYAREINLVEREKRVGGISFLHSTPNHHKKYEQTAGPVNASRQALVLGVTPAYPLPRN